MTMSIDDKTPDPLPRPAEPAWRAEAAGLDLLGYSAPLPLTELERAEAVRAANIDAPRYTKNPHRDQAGVRALLNDPGLTAAVARLCGDDLAVWRSAFFAKSEGSGEIGWHHDKHFHRDGEDDIRLDEIGTHFSVLFGLTEIAQGTGMLEVLPGTHRPVPGLTRDTRPYHMRPAGEHLLTDLPPALLETRRGLPIPAGSFVVFHSALLHHSLPHRGGVPRLGLAIRLAPAAIAVPDKLAAPGDVLPFPPAP